MSNIVFVQPLAYEFPGTEILSACLKVRGHRVDVVIAQNPSAGDPVFRDAHLLCFSVMTGFERWTVKTAQALKTATGAKVAVGGPHPTHCPEMIFEEGIDYLCRGEGEEPLCALADALEAGESGFDIPSLWVKESGGVRKNPQGAVVTDLNALPHPDRALYYDRYPFLAQNPHRPFMAGRGCPFDCIFCSNKALNALYPGTANLVRLKSPQKLVEEIARVKNRHGLKKVFFHDDTFVLNKKWLFEFLDLYSQVIDLPFYCQSRADSLTAEVAERLARAGCRTVFFAVESGVERIRCEVLKKKISDEDIYAAARNLKRNGIKVSTYNLIGIPGETLADALETVRMNIALGADFPRCSFPTPYPGTALLNLARQEGLLPAAPGITPLSQQTELLFVTKDRLAFKNLHSLFQASVLFPRLYPLLPSLVKLPLGPLYKVLWYVTYPAVFLRAEGRTLAGSLKLLVFMAKQKLLKEWRA